MIKLIQMYLRIKVYKWLITWHQRHADSATYAFKSQNVSSTIDMTKEQEQTLKIEWYDRWGYHMDRMKEIETKLENLW